jgi:hypothetical protein
MSLLTAPESTARSARRPTRRCISTARGRSWKLLDVRA